MFPVLHEFGSTTPDTPGARQRTLKRSVSLSGIGVHTGATARLTLHPAPANTGVVFAIQGRSEPLAAHWTNVVDTTLRTALGNQDGFVVHTVEHLLAACAGLGVDNLRIGVDGPELPGLDGSAAAFVAAIDEAGYLDLPEWRATLKVLKPIRVQFGRSFAEFLPAECGLTLDIEIEFPEAVIGRQRKILTIDPGTLRRELMRARSFGFLRDLAPLQARGLALGASLDNTIGLLDDAVLNPEGLRFPDECVRHKMLDVLGDLALAGQPITGVFRSYCGGHALNIAALRALFSDASAFSFDGARSRPRSQCGISAAGR
jgi:UDP-3-O-[3-hydroxymyristoyl] N-acetylglucosamine deacetylase